MTLVAVLSVKGAPGVTTLSCLLATAWRGPGPVAVVEADPAGGDLAARFGLSAMLGQASLSAAVRRGGSDVRLEPHLQRLPGGLDVLVGGGPGEGPEPAVIEAVARAWSGGLAVVDLGRVAGSPAPAWLARCDHSLLLCAGDPAGALHVRTHAPGLLDATDGRLGVVVVGRGAHDSAEVGRFAGIRPAGDLPFDPAAAAVASGASGAGRRLERSGLLAAVRRLAGQLGPYASDEAAAPAADRDQVPDGPVPVRPGAGVR